MEKLLEQLEKLTDTRRQRILTKEGMYRYTVHYARKLDSASLMASAWDHRSDALSSIGALVGVAGARLGYPILEHIASIVICLFILKSAVDIFREAMNKMLDHSAGEEIEKQLAACAAEQKQVLGVDLIRTRQFGSRIYVDIEISADGNLTLSKSHEIAQAVHDAIESRFEKVKHIMVHVNPHKAQTEPEKNKEKAPTGSLLSPKILGLKTKDRPGLVDPLTAAQELV